MLILQEQSAFSVVVAGFQTLVLAPVAFGVLFKVHLQLPLGALGVTPSDRSDWWFWVPEESHGHRHMPGASSSRQGPPIPDFIVYSGTNFFLFRPSSCPDLCCGGLLTPPDFRRRCGTTEGQVLAPVSNWAQPLPGCSLKPSNRENHITQDRLCRWFYFYSFTG